MEDAIPDLYSRLGTISPTSSDRALTRKKRALYTLVQQLSMALSSRHARRVASAILSGQHVCISCRQTLSRRQYASVAIAQASVETPPMTQMTPDDPAASPLPQPRYNIKAGVVLSRPPLITPDPHPFETSYYLYQRRLNERLVLPFTQYFYYKRGTPSFEHWRTKRRERAGAAARDVGPYNA